MTEIEIRSAGTVPKHPGSDRRRLGRRAQWLAAVSVIYNLAEVVVAFAAGMVAGSTALIGFGLGSVVEVSSGLIVIWQFRHPAPQSRQRLALHLMAASFWALAGYVTFESVRALAAGAAAEASTIGICLAAASLMVMPVLSAAQLRTGRALGSQSVVADSTQTRLCSFLSAALLVGLALNAWLGWAWADPLAGLCIAALAAWEGGQAWRGDGCCGPVMSRDDDSARCVGGCCSAS